MNVLMAVIVMALATWRLANMLADPEQVGPFEILSRIRTLAGMRYDLYSKPYASTNFAKGMMCVYCNSIWIGGLFLGLFIASSIVAFYVALPFALSAAAIWIEEHVKEAHG